MLMIIILRNCKNILNIIKELPERMKIEYHHFIHITAAIFFSSTKSAFFRSITKISSLFLHKVVMTLNAGTIKIRTNPFSPMGCGKSAPSGAAKSSGEARGRASQKPKAPILLFYLPGRAKETFTTMISKDLVNPSDGTGTLNIRFVDAQNQRALRRFWMKELTTKRDYATFIFLADLRDHPTLLLNARTLNWFLRMTYKNYDIPVIAIYNEESQVQELKSYLPDVIEFMAVNEKDRSSIDTIVTMLHETEIKFNDQRRTTTTKTITNQIL